jgi:hypothetical protein
VAVSGEECISFPGIHVQREGGSMENGACVSAWEMGSCFLMKASGSRVCGDVAVSDGVEDLGETVMLAFWYPFEARSGLVRGLGIEKRAGSHGG